MSSSQSWPAVELVSRLLLHNVDSAVVRKKFALCFQSLPISSSGAGGRNRSLGHLYRRVKTLDLSDRCSESDPGEERIAPEFEPKLGIRVSLRTVRKYLNRLPHPRGSKDQRWSTSSPSRQAS